MPAVPEITESYLTLHFPDRLRMSEDEFFEFCGANPEVRFERSAGGDILILALVGGETSISMADVTCQLVTWAKADGTGRAFGSSAGFTLPNKAVRSPNASWILKTRLQQLPKEDLRRFAHICPDFAIEVKSECGVDSFLQVKMEEYIVNGARLGWLIDPELKRVHVYRPNRAVELLDNITSVSADPELPDFTLDLTTIWNPDAD